MTPEIVRELAPKGYLRAGINLSNNLLVTGKSPSGDPEGVAPDLAAEIAKRLGVSVKYVTYLRPILLAEAATNDEWDIGLIGAEPQRAEQIAFSAAYSEIEATYLVPAGSPLQSVAEVDKPGIHISVNAGSAYDLWLVRNIKHAELIHSPSTNGAFERFAAEKLEALAALKPQLLLDIGKVPGARILDGKFMTVQQAIGTPRKNTAGAAYLAAFVEEAKSSGLIARLIERHKVQGLSVAPAAWAASAPDFPIGYGLPAVPLT